MNAAGAAGGARWLRVALGVLALLAVAISPQSFWGDEGNSAYKAMQPTLSAWWASMVELRGSDIQMPLYMLYLWGWEKLFGASELALRWANAPWILLGAAVLARVRWGWAAVVLSPALAYYANDARPYAMQFGATALACAPFVGGAPAGGRGRWAWAAGLLLLAGSSLLGVIWGGGLGVLALARMGRGEWKRWIGPMAVVAVGLAGLAAYYGWTLAQGMRATPMRSSQVINFGFALYELGGLAGLGPGRNTLRAEGVGAFLPYAPVLVPGALLLAAVGVIGAIGWVRGRPAREIALVLAAIGLPLAAIFGIGVLKEFRVLGRHLMPGLVPLLMLWACGCAGGWKRGGLARAAVVGAMLVWGVSILSLRFAGRHAKDDYRGAAAAAREVLAAGGTVWWSADVWTGRVYGLEVTERSLGADLPLRLMTRLSEVAEEGPALAVTTRPDVYDPNRVLVPRLEAWGYRGEPLGTAFVLWKKPGAPAGDPAD